MASYRAGTRGRHRHIVNKGEQLVGFLRSSIHRRRGRAGRVGAALIGFVLIAAACSDRKDDEAVSGGGTTPGTDAPATTSASATTTGGTEGTSGIEAPATT